MAKPFYKTLHNTKWASVQEFETRIEKKYKYRCTVRNLSPYSTLVTVITPACVRVFELRKQENGTYLATYTPELQS